MEKVKNISEEQLQVLQDALRALEIMVTVADDKRKLALISLLVQSLCRLLCANSADEWRLLSQPSRRVHEFAIQRLNAIAPLWPVEFKQVLESHPLLKSSSKVRCCSSRVARCKYSNSQKQKQSLVNPRMFI
ncbi:hypothetical protein KIN20_002324 [Parelaphostrongylus tenuis]|uniref:Uncharacterized protein n=1 Tax=Parelaphostrongylus tenuis TaxID=148309 RepID=A0AAD5LZM1_PARTN|nr:hypothetical protein KIN20_002324 [Parelaphostrongylus tenuis]